MKRAIRLLTAFAAGAAAGIIMGLLFAEDGYRYVKNEGKANPKNNPGNRTEGGERIENEQETELEMEILC